MTESCKIAIVGAATIRGKELNETLADTVFSGANFSLMDDESQLGQLEAVGDEVTFIQRIEPSAFEGMDFVFFAGSQPVTLRHWSDAHKAGASIIDISGALEGNSGVLVRAPWLHKDSPTLSTPAVVPAHPVAVALGLIMARLSGLAVVTNASATVLEPASEYGNAALDELHQQTVGLLNFQTLPKAIFDTQVAFNIVPVLGGEAKADLRGSEDRIRRHYGLLAKDILPAVAVQLLHAPVFHGYGISLAVELGKPVSLRQVETILGSEHIQVTAGDADADVPNNLNSVGQSGVMTRVRTVGENEAETTRFWIWAALDNLKLAALNAVACAEELRKLRPQGKVQ